MLFSFYYLNIYSSSELPNKVDRIIKRNRITNYIVEDLLSKKYSNFLSKVHHPEYYDSYKIKDTGNNEYLVIFDRDNYNKTYILDSDEKFIYGMIDEIILDKKYWDEF